MKIDTSAAAIAAVLEGVMQGPWLFGIAEDDISNTELVIYYGDDEDYVAQVYECAEQYANANFIAFARDLVPAMSAELTALRAERDALVDQAKVAAQAIGQVALERDAALARVAVLESALQNIKELNPLPPDEFGNRCENSDLIGQEIRAALTNKGSAE